MLLISNRPNCSLQKPELESAVFCSDDPERAWDKSVEATMLELGLGVHKTA